MRTKAYIGGKNNHLCPLRFSSLDAVATKTICAIHIHCSAPQIRRKRDTTRSTFSSLDGALTIHVWQMPIAITNQTTRSRILLFIYALICVMYYKCMSSLRLYTANGCIILAASSMGHRSSIKALFRTGSRSVLGKAFEWAEW